jgi:hypothetical protein
VGEGRLEGKEKGGASLGTAIFYEKAFDDYLRELNIFRHALRLASKAHFKKRRDRWGLKFEEGMDPFVSAKDVKIPYQRDIKSFRLCSGCAKPNGEAYSPADSAPGLTYEVEVREPQKLWKKIPRIYRLAEGLGVGSIFFELICPPKDHADGFKPFTEIMRGLKDYPLLHHLFSERGSYKVIVSGNFIYKDHDGKEVGTDPFFSKEFYRVPDINYDLPAYEKAFRKRYELAMIPAIPKGIPSSEELKGMMPQSLLSSFERAYRKPFMHCPVAGGENAAFIFNGIDRHQDPDQIFRDYLNKGPRSIGSMIHLDDQPEGEPVWSRCESKKALHSEDEVDSLVEKRLLDMRRAFAKRLVELMRYALDPQRFPLGEITAAETDLIDAAKRIDERKTRLQAFASMGLSRLLKKDAQLHSFFYGVAALPDVQSLALSSRYWEADEYLLTLLRGKEKTIKELELKAQKESEEMDYFSAHIFEAFQIIRREVEREDYTPSSLEMIDSTLKVLEETSSARGRVGVMNQ